MSPNRSMSRTPSIGRSRSRTPSIGRSRSRSRSAHSMSRSRSARSIPPPSRRSAVTGKRKRTNSATTTRKISPTNGNGKRRKNLTQRSRYAKDLSSPSIQQYPIFQKRFSPADFTTPHRLMKDCCICVFRMLGLVNKSQTEAGIDLYGESGMELSAIHSVFNEKWPDHHFMMGTEEVFGTSKHRMINSVLKTLQPGYATLMGWRDMHGLKHCFSLARGLDDSPMFLDAQTREYYTDLQSIHRRLSSMQNIYVLFAKHKNTNQPLVVDSLHV